MYLNVSVPLTGRGVVLGMHRLHSFVVQLRLAMSCEVAGVFSQRMVATESRELVNVSFVA